MSLYTFISNNERMNNFITANKFLVTSAVLAISFVLLLGPISMTMNVFATTNTANQGIGQSQSSTQLGVCVSGDGTLFSCNNLSDQNQANSGSNAAAQSGGSDEMTMMADGNTLTKV